MARSGAILREVGTTNRTHPRDYREAITAETALILKVHPSNYRIEGFTREVELDEIVALGRETGIPTMMDLGSGCLVDLSPFGLEGETTVQEVISKGVDVVTFSGDKLLGGPQAGIVAGRGDLLEKLRTNPLARALRMDKLTLAGLEATLEEYTRADGPFGGVPALAMIITPAEKLRQTAEMIVRELEGLIGNEADVRIEPGVGRVGGGALPLGDLPGPRVAVRPRHVSVARLARRLRTGQPPLITIVKEDAILVDPRTLLHDQARLVPRLLAAALDAGES
jgi:L-seryl-tRNA(Ser) seleniumtransferase